MSFIKFGDFFGSWPTISFTMTQLPSVSCLKDFGHLRMWSPYSMVDGYQNFKKTCCHHLQGTPKIEAEGSLLKRWHSFTRLHIITPMKQQSSESPLWETQFCKVLGNTIHSLWVRRDTQTTKTFHMQYTAHLCWPREIGEKVHWDSGSTQPCEPKWGPTWKKGGGSSLEKWD